MKMNEAIRMTLVLTLVCIVSAVSLSISYEQLIPMIEDNQAKELKLALNGVLPQADSFEEVSDVGTYVKQDDKVTIERLFKAVDSKDNTVGYAFIAVIGGYQGYIHMLVGVEPKDDDYAIKSIKIMQHQETPGLGARIAEQGFLNQFFGKGKEAKADDYDAITGATVSSAAVISAVTYSMQNIDFDKVK